MVSLEQVLHRLVSPPLLGLSRHETRAAVSAEEAPKSSTVQEEQAQEQHIASDPDSPMLDPNKKDGPVDLETAAHDGVFNQFVADQLLSKGQRINIGSPDTYFRPAYATAAGVKSAPDADDPSQFAKGRLQVCTCKPHSSRKCAGDWPRILTD